MGQYILRRLALVVPQVWVGVTLIFVLFRLVPGDPATLMAGLSATQSDIDRLRHQLGLDQPLYVQYVQYLWGLLRGDLGISPVFQDQVVQQLVARYPVTIKLAILTMALASVVGVGIGVFAAVRHRTWLDYVSMVGAVGGVSIPNFWLGLMLAFVFAVQLKLVPISGGSSPASVILPVVTLATYPTALLARMTRSSMLDVLNQDYVRTARAKGLAERWVILRHALTNTLIPVVTVAGLQFGYLLGGAIVVESVFAWPGIGLLMIDSIRARDYTMVQAIALTFALTFLFVNLAVDLLYARLDPQVRYT